MRPSHTPEILLKRSDSKDPATTCAGLTSTGRLCRRPLPIRSSPEPKTDCDDHATLFCWQHRSQAEVPQKRTKIDTKLKHRSSIETIVERLGSFRLTKEERSATNRQLNKNAQPRHQQPGLFTLFCCFSGTATNEGEYLEVVRHRSRQPGTHPNNVRNVRTHASNDPSSLIPSDLPLQTRSSLMAELSKPISSGDESGYIYAYLLTPDSIQAPSTSEASVLLQPKETQPRSASVQRYASVRRSQQANAKFLIKVGRTNNVHRRMNQWTKQCNQNITLIRYYPHASLESTAPSKKVPFTHRVERLIHIELEGHQADKSECSHCGREHREWFEIEASERGLRNLDSTIKRWVKFAETKAKQQARTTTTTTTTNE